jgi:hypothetical protein
VVSPGDTYECGLDLCTVSAPFSWRDFVVVVVAVVVVVLIGRTTVD